MTGQLEGGADVQSQLLEVDGLSVTFRTAHGEVFAVRDATFTIERGSIVGLVGESGSGKTVTGLTILGLNDPRVTRYGGSIRLNGEELLGRKEKEWDRIRGAEIGMVFQEPMTALNPLMTVGAQVSETLRQHRKVSRKDARARAIEVLDQVGIPSPAKRAESYPHELSGGLRQRAMIAAAIVCHPKLLIADEPTTALDVTIQAQVLELIADLAREESMSVLLVTHDLGVVAEICDRVVTMYAGEVVERGPAAEVLEEPAHPYTRRLLEARPSLDGWKQPLPPIPGTMPSASAEPEGCRFAPRCRLVRPECTTRPISITAFDVDRAARCVLVEDHNHVEVTT
jgi:oligopeptide/dipeptide ABC transporter ATP-binding protein